MTTVPDIKQTVLIEAPIQKVWDLVSTGEAIGTWFMPNDLVAEEGHEFHIQSPFGPSPCKVLEVDPPHRLTFSWDTEGWFVEFLLKEIDGKTEFTLIHGGWKDSEAIIGKANRTNAEVRETMNGGWAGIVQKLRQVATN
ncbi:SRPBCC domain-containing protein [Bacillus timonensis]|uniref:SRPBCC domain-containing protein n=1 Tax=Bacillus timonensis TaxID=1033734 RepID=A0A4S3PVQ5_9BACI|nr:SRPBCC domain-containing protein [Bacillus timonensis]THE13496.1 SRPBCC domain-containing protein [Bacillus timonensis]